MTTAVGILMIVLAVPLTAAFLYAAALAISTHWTRPSSSGWDLGFGQLFITLAVLLGIGAAIPIGVAVWIFCGGVR